MKKVFYLSRAYNDLDCRLPLLLEFARDPSYRVEVIGVPSNAGLYDPRSHELSGELARNGVRVATIYDRPRAGILLRLAVGLFRLVDRLGLGDGSKRAAFKPVHRLSLRNEAWSTAVLEEFQGSVVILDEIGLQRGRSFFVDKLIDQQPRWKYRMFAFSTGQDPYLNLWHDKADGQTASSSSPVGTPLLVCGSNDKRILERKFPGESIEVVGNTRFDLPWVKFLEKDSADRNQRDPVLGRAARHKVVFMLSKIEYGVDLDNIIGAINACAALPEACTIVKPHTRGMSIESWGSRLDRRVIDGTRLPSSDLMLWADTVLFTGSSIAFQAMQLGKKVIFLKYCQQYQTILDDSPAVLIAKGLEDVTKYAADGQLPAPAAEVGAFLTEHVYNGVTTGRVVEAVKSRIERAAKL